ncbi:MAG: hypothetical protein E7813_11580 [Bradyrhizobium sp.]|uniref:hypothetical protein n=1 Tax=Bradyrhizobium sp. TaxID=376 RepID=UPI0011FEF5CC|nr:hypothetical protein [Bradyrhizobium sp.]THD68135.1 MAG: hypothetical protein E7813_11580 [Bradyrhizobium sp.]
MHFPGKEDETLKGEIKTLESALDYHTVENRNKRKTLQERRNTLAKQMEATGAAMQHRQRGLNELHQRIETNLQLAKNAETWEWKEIA